MLIKNMVGNTPALTEKLVIITGRRSYTFTDQTPITFERFEVVKVLKRLSLGEINMSKKAGRYKRGVVCCSSRLLCFRVDRAFRGMGCRCIELFRHDHDDGWTAKR